VLSDCEIRNLVHEKGLIDPFDENKLQAVSYDISAGDVVRVYQRLNQEIDLENRQQMQAATSETMISKKRQYHIKPGEYVLVKTRERFQIPENLTAHVRPRTTFSRIGLLLSDQHMNPSFRGYLFLGLLNATPNIINISPGLSIGQMVFETVQGEISGGKLYEQKKDAHYQDEDAFIPPVLTQEEQAVVERMVNQMMGR